jgi:copper chaperone NosL
MRRRAFLVGLSALALAACTKDDEPVDPVWGKEPCAHCKMLVSDKRFAAQLVTAEGDRHHFDDVGCMVLWMGEHKAAPKRFWARDAQTGQWLDARSARYASGARTPMDYGFEARAEGGVAWDEVRAAVAKKEREVR